MGFVYGHFEELDEIFLLLRTLKYSYSLFFCVFWFKINEKDKESSIYVLFTGMQPSTLSGTQISIYLLSVNERAR